MRKKLPISVAEDVYAGPYRVAGASRISQFVDAARRPFNMTSDIETGYAAMSTDEEREEEALEWVETIGGDVANGAR